MLRSPAEEGKHLDLIFPSLGKNCRQQLAGTRESAKGDELHLSSLLKGFFFFFVYTHICSQPHTYTHPCVHTYIHIYEEGYKEFCVCVSRSIVSNSLQSSGH